ncbi:uncharacterized protein G2W53_022444 [Senna tora]|uniref:Uncharacterized protein n=1 Tax=Senna tora TaxID=362788 RepID=A0A834WI54_9FABA|nr:uncharacterized protein G2W53_022444 [Senna tora]
MTGATTVMAMPGAAMMMIVNELRGREKE